MPNDDLDPELSFQRYSNDKRFGVQKEHYYTGPQKDLSPEKDYIERLDRQLMRKLLANPSCNLRA